MVNGEEDRCNRKQRQQVSKEELLQVSGGHFLVEKTGNVRRHVNVFSGSS